MRHRPFVLGLGLVVFVAAACWPAIAPAQTDPLEGIRAYHKVSDRLATSGQITNEQIPQLEAAGFDVVVNLAIADQERNGQEGFLVVEQGMTYVHIPVSWQEPSQEHLRQFFEVMAANEGRKVFVHCFANMRASAFTYLYRTLRAGEADDVARPDLMAIWDPFTDERSPQWGAFIDAARAQPPH
jgi:uncharacterized protein (TIGR01244 family)